MLSECYSSARPRSTILHRSLIESNIDALITTDTRGIITDVNKQMEALTGCTRDELIGAPFKDYFTDPERAEAGIKLVLGERKLTDYELTARARDGKETVVSYNASTFHDRDRSCRECSQPPAMFTERKRYEQSLQAGYTGQERGSGQHVARDPHADECHPGVLTVDASRPGSDPASMPVPGHHQSKRRALAGSDQRHPEMSKIEAAARR